jgi:hypothetical protein
MPQDIGNCFRGASGNLKTAGKTAPQNMGVMKLLIQSTSLKGAVGHIANGCGAQRSFSGRAMANKKPPEQLAVGERCV